MLLVFHSSQVNQPVTGLDGFTDEFEGVNSPAFFSYPKALAAPSAQAAGKKKNLNANLEFDSLEILPGTNVGIKETVFSNCYDHNPQFKEYVDSGIIWVPSPDLGELQEGSDEHRRVYDLTALYSEAQVKILIKHTQDVDWLQKCLEQENRYEDREAVRSAIQIRIVQIKRSETDAEREYREQMSGTRL